MRLILSDLVTVALLRLKLEADPSGLPGLSWIAVVKEIMDDGVLGGVLNGSSRGETGASLSGLAGATWSSYGVAFVPP